MGQSSASIFAELTHKPKYEATEDPKFQLRVLSYRDELVEDHDEDELRQLLADNRDEYEGTVSIEELLDLDNKAPNFMLANALSGIEAKRRTIAELGPKPGEFEVRPPRFPR